MNVNRPTGIPNMNPYHNRPQEPVLKQQKSNSKDQVHISKQAQAMLEQQPPTDAPRQQKVAQLKEAVQNGTYEVDSRQVAEQVYQFWYGKKG